MLFRALGSRSRGACRSYLDVAPFLIARLGAGSTPTEVDAIPGDSPWGLSTALQRRSNTLALCSKPSGAQSERRARHALGLGCALGHCRWEGEALPEPVLAASAGESERWRLLVEAPAPNLTAVSSALGRLSLLCYACQGHCARYPTFL